jgi:hypothetical protein
VSFPFGEQPQRLQAALVLTAAVVDAASATLRFVTILGDSHLQAKSINSMAVRERSALARCI